MSEVETSKQVQRWRDFSAAVEEHITNYVMG